MVPLWRFNNPLNQTVLRSIDSARLLIRVKVGRASRGNLNVLGPSTGEAQLNIGRFVTLGDNVNFVVGEVPPSGNALATYWSESTTSDAGSITVNDDVWIGSCSFLLSGITIGQGAIIMAGSVVTDDVPPYSRVSGNPARVIDYRFPPEVIEKLCAYQFSTLVDDVIAKVGTALLAPLNADNVDEFLHLLKVAGMPSEQVPSPVQAPEPQGGQPIPAVLILDGAGEASKVETSLSALAEGLSRDLPIIILTTQAGDMPEWTDSLRYVQTSENEFTEAVEQLRALPDFDWVSIIEAGQ
jgi:acetyltransferase-like isoleucine patch superfamily enzyme